MSRAFRVSGPLSDIAPFIRAHAQCLEGISIITSDCPNTQPCHLYAFTPSRPDAIVLEIRVPVSTAYNEHDPWLDLSPAYTCPNLRVLEIFDSLRLLITDDEVDRMLQTWQHLQYLILNPRPTLSATPLLTLRSLVTVAEGGPCLRSAGLCLDLSAPFDRGSGSTWESLGSLDLGRSTPTGRGLTRGEVQNIAAFLQNRFPRAELFSSSRSVYGIAAMLAQMRRALYPSRCQYMRDLLCRWSDSCNPELIGFVTRPTCFWCS